MTKAKDEGPPKGLSDEAVREALEADAREMLRASGKDPDDPEALKRLLDGAADPLERLMYTRAEAAYLCGFSLRTYVRMHNQGNGPPEIVFTPDVVRVSRRALEQWLTERDINMAKDLKASAKKAATKEMVVVPGGPRSRAAKSVGVAIGSAARRRKNRPSLYDPPEPKPKPSLRAVPKKRSS